MKTRGLRLEQAPPLHLPFRFFLTAPVFGMAAGMLLTWKGADLLGSPWTFATVALAHLITLGFITMVMVGALYQIVPVLVGYPLPRARLAVWVHVGLCVGLPAMAAGLLSHVRPLLWLAVAAFAPAFLIVLGQLAVALVRAPSSNATVHSIRLAVAALALSVSLGALFLWEYAFGWLPIDRRAMIATHLYLALGGWIGALITGVGQAVIPMFYLSTEFPKRQAGFILICQGMVLVSGVSLAFFAPSPVWHLLPLSIAAAGLAVFTTTVWRLLRGRKRQITDVTLRFRRVGLVSAPLSLAALAVFAVRPEPRRLFAFGALFLLGFAGAIINGMLYKIAAFLVWLHRFSKQAGKVDVPLLKDIISPSQTGWQWWSYLIMLALLLPAVLTARDLLVRLTGAMLVITFGEMFFILLKAALFQPDLEGESSAAPTAFARALSGDEAGADR